MSWDREAARSSAAGVSHGPTAVRVNALHRPRNVILVSIDSLRTDHLSFGGYPRSTTPFLDELVTGREPGGNRKEPGGDPPQHAQPLPAADVTTPPRWSGKAAWFARSR